MKHLTATLWLYALLASSPLFSQKDRLLFDAAPDVSNQGCCTGLSDYAQQRNGGETRLRASRCNFWTVPGNITSGDSILYVYDANNNVAETTSLNYDTTGWSFSFRHIYNYDALGNVLLDSTLSWNNASWEKALRIVNTYNVAHQITAKTIEFWVNNEWKVQRFYTWEYDTQGRLLIETWGAYRDIYAYDSNNNQISDIIQSNTGGNWEDSHRILNTYNAQNQPLSELDQIWDATFWHDNNSNQYEYDANGNLLSSSEYYMDSDGTWINGTKKTFAYDNHNNLLTYLNQKGDSITWTNVQTNHYAYDAGDHRTSILVQNWDSTGWVNYSLFTTDYDINGNKTLDFGAFWDNGAWINGNQFWYFYDAEGHKIEDLVKKWSNDEWVDRQHCHYYYEAATGLHDFSSQLNTFKIFPNPAQSSLLLQMENGGAQRAQIFDLQGHLLYTQILPDTDIATLNLAGIPNGCYILQVVEKAGKTAAKPFFIAN